MGGWAAPAASRVALPGSLRHLYSRSAGSLVGSSARSGSGSGFVLARRCLSAVQRRCVAAAIAFGIAATGTSEGALVGLYGAIFAGFFAAVLGGHPASHGPHLPNIVVGTATIAAHGARGRFRRVHLAGVFQILFGVCRLGSLIRYFRTRVSGFMGGIALIIIIGELDQARSSFLLVLVTIVRCWVPAGSSKRFRRAS